MGISGPSWIRRDHLVIGLMAAGLICLSSKPATAASGGTPSETGAVIAKVSSSAQLSVIAPASAIPTSARPIGPAPAGETVAVDVVLKARQPGQLSAFVADVSTPGSAGYRHYLTPPQFAGRFGADAAAVQTIRSVLQADGLRPGVLDADHLVLHVSGNANDIERAFHTSLFSYRVSSGQVGYASREAARLPTTIAGFVAGVTGLDDLPVKSANGLSPDPVIKGRSGAAASSTSCPQASPNNSDKLGYWTPEQIAEAYDMTPLDAGDPGAGERIGLVEHQGGFNPSDIATYAATSCYDVTEADTAKKVDKIVHLHPVDGASTSSPNDETTADIEVLLGLAPNVAGIDVYVNPDNGVNGDVATWEKVASADDPVVSDSAFANCENDPGLAAAEAPIFQELAAQGQSVFVSSGDFGSDPDGSSQGDPPGEGYGCSAVDGVYPMNDPASQPDVTAVGGTTLTALGKPPPAIGEPPAKAPTETTWNNRTSEGCKALPQEPSPHCPVGFGGASGGGVSTVWPMPDYQQFWAGGPGPMNTGKSCGNDDGYCREVPDVSASADGYHGYPIYFDGAWLVGTVDHVNYSEGGTSLAAPTWAAMTALIDQSCRAPVGFLNPALYQLASTGDSDLYLNDVTTGNNDWTGQLGNQYAAGVGYDMATGLGSPVAANLASYLCSSAWTYQSSLTGANGKGTGFGSSIADSNGNEALVGAPGQDGGQGAAYLITDLALNQSQLLSDPNGRKGDSFGYAVTQATDEMIVSAPGAKAVYVYNFNGDDGDFTLTQTILPPTGSAGSGRFGYSVAADDGSTLIVGDPTMAGDGTGAAYVYEADDSGVFSLQQSLSAPSGAEDDGDYGYSVGANFADSEAAVAVGDPGQGQGAGAVYPYILSGTAWESQPALTAADGAPQTYFGTSLSMGAGLLAVGAPSSVSGPPEAYVYSNYGLAGGGSPTELTPSGVSLWESNPAPSGVAVKVLTNVFGDLVGVAVGLPPLDEQHNGAAFVYGYQQESSSWTLEAGLADPYNNGDDGFGTALGLSSTGQLLVGSPGYVPVKPNSLHGATGLVGIYGPVVYYP
jgi:subtilase family serine protease